MPRTSTADREIGRRRLIERPRLTRMLDETTARIILLTAPAGYGKTTLAQQWLSDRPHAWYRGTPASADVAALALGLADAAAEIVPGAADRLRERLRVTNHPEEETDILAELLAEDLAGWPAQAWLAIDDYQFAMDSEAVERFVQRLTELDALCLFVTSRQRPTWATARRILYGEILQLEREVLAMSDEEAREVLASGGEAASTLVELAKGWPAVIGLAALSDRLSPPDDYLPVQLYDYFAEEVYLQAEPAVRWGLCQLAIAPSITTRLAQHLFGVETGALIIEHGVRLGVFVSERPGAVGLHPLLRTFLRSRLREQRQETMESLVSAVVSFLLSELRADDAFGVIEEFPREDRLIELIESALDDMLRAGRLSTVDRWVKLGRNESMKTPLLDLVEAEIAFRQGDHIRAHALASQASAELGRDHPFAARALLRAGQSAHFDSQDDIALTLHRRAREIATSEDEATEAALGEMFSALELESEDAKGIWHQLDKFQPDTPRVAVRLFTAQGQFAVRLGLLSSDLDRLLAGMQLLPTVNDPLARSAFVYVMSYALGVAGRYDEALELADAAVSEAERYRLDFALRHGLVSKAIAQAGLRHFVRSIGLLKRAEKLAAAAGDAHVIWFARAVRLRAEAAQGAETDLASQERTGLDARLSKAMLGEYLSSLGLVHASRGDAGLARKLADEAESMTYSAETRALVAWTRAIAAQPKEPGDAKGLVEYAFDECERLGHRDFIVCAYRSFRPLLSILASDSQRQSSLQRILERAHDFDLAREHGIELRRPSSTDTLATLTPREEQVYELLAQGLSNREIAQTLFISEPTAKVHVRRILKKFGARSRTEAVARGRGEVEAD
jgi:LuxR family transcriptional regulator, maltose regulon positive regulatory protein